eukprot:gene24263-29335_t
MFGGTQSASSAPSSGFSFGSTTSAPTFGSTTSGTTQSFGSAPSFGSSTTPSFGSSTAPSFGANTSTPTASFGFGATNTTTGTANQSTASTTPSFSFGNTSAATSSTNTTASSNIFGGTTFGQKPGGVTTNTTPGFGFGNLGSTATPSLGFGNLGNTATNTTNATSANVDVGLDTVFSALPSAWQEEINRIHRELKTPMRHALEKIKRSEGPPNHTNTLNSLHREVLNFNAQQQVLVSRVAPLLDNLKALYSGGGRVYVDEALPVSFYTHYLLSFLTAEVEKVLSQISRLQNLGLGLSHQHASHTTTRYESVKEQFLKSAHSAHAGGLNIFDLADRRAERDQGLRESKWRGEVEKFALAHNNNTSTSNGSSAQNNNSATTTSSMSSGMFGTANNSSSALSSKGFGFGIPGNATNTSNSSTSIANTSSGGLGFNLTNPSTTPATGAFSFAPSATPTSTPSFLSSTTALTAGTTNNASTFAALDLAGNAAGGLGGNGGGILGTRSNSVGGLGMGSGGAGKKNKKK